MTELATAHTFCLRILRSGDLVTKLAEPGELADPPRGPAEDVLAPARDPGLRWTDGVAPLPRPGRLTDPGARAECLARFAHHELMAVELFAWALVRWPELPGGLRRGLLGVLSDEQRHCRLYLDRLAEHGARLEDFVLSDYFWKQRPAILAAPDPPLAFLCAMGLTLEQANLDFSLIYRDAFREAGDEASARVCQAVHDDEVGHVRLAAMWLRRLSRETDDVSRYEAAVPFPLSAARAKGRRFDAGARLAAGLEPAFVEHVRTARSSQEQRPRNGTRSG